MGHEREIYGDRQFDLKMKYYGVVRTGNICETVVRAVSKKGTLSLRKAV